MAPKVEKATLTDLDAIVKINEVVWSGDFLQKIFPTNPEGLEWYRRSYTAFVQGIRKEGGPEPRVFVVRDEGGQAVSAALYFIFRPGDDLGVDSFKKRWPPNDDVPGVDRQKLADFHNGMAARHVRLMGDRPHVFLEALMTLPEAREKGYASALVRHGNAIADELGWECFLNAVRARDYFYRGLGYVDHETAEDDLSVPMIRPKRAG